MLGITKVPSTVAVSFSDLDVAQAGILARAAAFLTGLKIDRAGCSNTASVIF